MLQTLARIKGLGVFSDFSWDAALPAFERFNLIYGDNGSGKTTLSRLLDSLVAARAEDYPDLEYRIETDSAPLTVDQASARRIRVFNADYVNRNIGLLDGNLKPILVIGEENKALTDRLKAEEAEEAKRRQTIAVLRDRLEDHGQAKGKLFTRVASTISQAIVGSSTRTYRKNNAEADYARLESFAVLEEKELQAYRLTLQQEVMDVVAWPASLTFERAGEDMGPDEIVAALTSGSKDLGARTAAGDAISRLKNEPDIAAWVERGLALHKKKHSLQCEFCEQRVPERRWVQLEAYFNAADQELKDEISRQIEEVEKFQQRLLAIRPPNRTAVYRELRERLDDATSSFAAAQTAAQNAIEKLLSALQSKLLSRSIVMTVDVRCDVTDLIRSWDALAKIIGEHNTKTAQFDEERTGARDKITNHFLSEMHAEVTLLDDLTTADKAALKQEQLGAEGQLSLEALQQSIAEKKAQISNSHKAGEKLTTLLHTFLARAELTFNSSDEGDRLMRHGKPARRLSDGERTAIAFIYFIVQLGDQEFDLEDGIVVIDDPVSSLDASSIYQAFAFLKNAVQDAKQVFLFTHNFGFLRLVLNWLTHGQLRRHSRFYMLVCRSEADGRRTALRALDKTLIDHPTEYHFLFKTLAEFRGDGTIAACYHIPNVARKILETFLDFHVPGTANVYSKLNTLDFDENKRTAIYKFTNDLSHRTGQGFEPGLVDESQKNANYLLELIEHVAPKHYQGMLAAIGNSSA